MTSDTLSLEYVCARWAYSELLSARPYYGSELMPLREKLARGVPFDELDSVERALLLYKWRQVRGDPAVVKRLRLPLRGTLGFEKAEVTAGGVALDEVDSRTMRSKREPELFLAGEVLDLDGPIGGYNFQAAWSTGWLAGSCV